MEFFHLSNFIYINIGLFLGVVFGAIPGLTVILCIVLFLPFTYTLGPIQSFMFLLGFYCAGSYGGSISAILIKTPGTPHATATMLDGYPLTEQGKSQKALNIALQASTFGGVVSALVLLLFSPQVAKFTRLMGTPEYFLVCAFGLTIISGVSGKSLIKGIISGALGLFVSTIGLDPMNSGTRFVFNNINFYSGINLVVSLIGLFALSEVLNSSTKSGGYSAKNIREIKKENGKITPAEYKQMALPAAVSALIGIIIGIIPGTGASEAAFFSYDRVKRMSKHKEDFGKGSIEGITAAETANNAVTGATLIPLLTLGIPGDSCVAIMLGALMINGLTPGPKLFIDHGVTMYAIIIGLIFVNLFMFIQGKYLTKLFAKIILIPKAVLTPIIVIFCFAGAYTVNISIFDIGITLVFTALAYLLTKLDFSIVPILLGLVLGSMTEQNFRRSLILSDGSPKIFVQSPISIAFLVIIGVTLVLIIKEKNSETKPHGDYVE